MKKIYSSKQWFIMLSAIIINLNNIFYMKSNNINQIIIITLILVVPTVVLVRYIYLQNITLMIKDISPLLTYLIDIFALVILSSLLVRLIATASWVLSGNGAVFKQLTILGLVIGGCLLFAILIQLKPNINKIYYYCIILSVVNLVIVPLLALSVIAMHYTRELSTLPIGYLLLDDSHLILFFTGIQLLFLLRTDQKQELNIAKALWPALVTICFVYFLGALIMHFTSTNTYALTPLTYKYQYFSLLVEHLNIFINIKLLVTLIAIYSCIHLFNLAMITYLLIYNLSIRSFERKRPSPYLSEQQNRKQYLKVKVMRLTLIFIAITCGFAIYAHNPQNFINLIDNASLKMQLLLNIVITIIVIRMLFRTEHSAKRYRFLAIMLCVVNVCVLFY